MPNIADRRDRVASIWNLKDEIVLVGCGSPVGLPGGADQCYEFRVHPEYRWLTGETRPGSILAFDPQEGWVRFTPAVTEAERVWDGVTEEPQGPYLTELHGWLERRSNRKIAFLGSITEEIAYSESFTEEMRQGLSRARRPKDEEEVNLMKKAAVATKAGHLAAKSFIRPGVSEREIQIELESAFLRAGADRPGYHSIVGTGPNSAVFHFTPSSRLVAPGDHVLIDAGAEVDGYVIDITRTYPADQSFAPHQQAIYDVLLDAQIRACERCTPGTEWLEFHTLCALDIAVGLRDLGLFKVTAQEGIESEAFALFMPHGIGHMVGLGVRDCSGAAPGRSGENKAAGVRVRCDLPLEPGYIMTVEPGIYFIPALLDDPNRRERFGAQIDWDKVDAYRGFGGMRIEDNVLVTDSVPVNLTADIPK